MGGGLGRRNEWKEEIFRRKIRCVCKKGRGRWRHVRDNELSHCSSDKKCMLWFMDHRGKHDVCIHLQKKKRSFTHAVTFFSFLLWGQRKRSLRRWGKGNQQHDIIGCVLSVRQAMTCYFCFSHFAHCRGVTAELYSDQRWTTLTLQKCMIRQSKINCLKPSPSMLNPSLSVLIFYFF